MSNLVRLQVNRPIQLLTEERINKLIIESHPAGVTSELYIALEELCKKKDYAGIIKVIIRYLKHERPIHALTQLDSDFVKFYKKLKNGIASKSDYEELIKLCDLRKFKSAFKHKEERGELFDEYTSVADTALTIALAGKLGHKENIDYIKLIKSYHLLDLIISKKKDISYQEIIQFLDRQVVLPSCFFTLNKCTKKLELIDLGKPFHYLELEKFENKDNGPISERPINQESDKTFLSNRDSQKDDCECRENCECDTCCQKQNPCCAEIFPYVSDLMVIKEELQCYEAKHLAYIETIMLGEERKREHRHLERTEDYTERETTRSESEEKDHQVAQRFSLQSEMQKTMDSDFSLDTGITVNTSGPSYSATATLDISSSTSKSESQRVAREQALDITERTVRKIQETVRELQSQKRILEIEETNKHVFKNSVSEGGTKHINGMYQFVNMISKGQVMNYGKRLMFELVLPEPMQLYRKLRQQELKIFDIDKPNKISISPDQITDISGSANYYLDLVREYGLQNVPAPPLQEKVISFSFSNDVALSSPSDYAGAQPIEVGTVPMGYKTQLMETNFWVKKHGDASSKEGWLFIAQGNIPEGYHAWNLSISEGEKISGSLLFQSSCAVAGSGIVKCVRTEKNLKEWRLLVYNKLIEKYEVELQEYNSEKAKYDADKERKAKLGRNPFLNREIERTELKRMAISYISCQFFDQFTAMKNKVEPCGNPQMDLEKAEKDGKFIQFFEQLFDWNLMTYIFYPYFWGRKCSWPEKIQSDSGDALFDKALMAGAARVQVPVRLGHEPLAIHWIAFGEIWNGSDEKPTPNSPYYISMAQEIKEQKGAFYADREGTISVNAGSTTVTLTNSSYHWDFGSSAEDQDKIDEDINREIIIDCEVYKIISIKESGSTTNHSQWEIELERLYEGGSSYSGPWSTGAVFVGAPFKITVPTSLVYLKNKKVNGEYVTEDCLPCFPQEKCE